MSGLFPKTDASKMPVEVPQKVPLVTVTEDATGEAGTAKKRMLLQGGKQSTILGGMQNIMNLKQRLGE